MSAAPCTLHVSEGSDYTCVWVENFPETWQDYDVQHTFETAAAAGDKTAIRACALIGAHWIDLKGWTYVDGNRVHARSRCYVDR